MCGVAGIGGARSTRQQSRMYPLSKTLYFAGAFFALLIILPFVSKLPLWAPVAYAAMSLLTFAVYWFDKKQAQLNNRRVPEATLHLLEVLGGWPGGLIAQWYLHHKNRKAAYQAKFWFCVVLNLVALAWVCSEKGDILLFVH